MRLLDRLILRELIGPFLFGVAAFASIFFAGGQLLKIIDEIVKGLPPKLAVEIVALQFPGVVALVLPMGVLLGTLLAVGRLSGESEMIALYAGGISLFRGVAAIFGLGIAVSALTFVLNENVAPVCTKRAHELKAKALNSQTTLAKPIPFADVKGNVTNSIVYVQNGIDPRTRTLRGVLVVAFRDNEPAMLFRAATARYEGGKNGEYTWRLRDGYYESLNPWKNKGGQQGLVSTLKFSSSGYTVKLRRSPEEIEGLQAKPEEMSFSQWLGHIRKLQLLGVSTTKEQVDLYNKIALPLSAFVFAVLACSLGIRSHRSGSSVGLGLSVLIIFVYWMVWRFASAFAAQGAFHPLVGSFAASLLALTAGLYLLARAAR